MKVFQQKDNNVIVSPEILTIPEFSNLWKADKTKDKVEAYKAFTFIYHFVDYNSPYSSYPRDKKEETIKKDMLGDAKFKISQPIIDAISKYRELQETPLQRLLQAARNKIDDIANYLNDTSVDDESIKLILEVYKNISTAVGNFDKLQQAVEKETEKQTSRNRGDINVNSKYNE
jgi:hypothetical protein